MSPEPSDTRGYVSIPGRARATLSQLRMMWGALEEHTDHVLRVGMYGHRERWNFISGRGASAIYEKTTGEE